MYDDCRDAFNSISPAGVRRLLTASAPGPEWGELTDDDVRGVLKLTCLVLATGTDLTLNDLVR